MRTLQKLGHPYTEVEIEAAPEQLEGLTQLDALVVYLQLLGTGLAEENQ
jgi:cytochrome c oxidase cbb3-type subunit 2